MLTLIALALIVFLAYATQAMIGFGANIIALTLGAHLLELETLLPVVVALNLPLSGWLVYKDHAAVDWPLLLRRIFPIMGAGFFGGVALSYLLHGSALALGFGIVVVALAGWELILLLRKPSPNQALGPAPFAAFVGLAGIVQGLYASGGPFLAYAAARLQLSRQAFRATLLVVWLVLNSLLTVNFAWDGRFNPTVGWWIAGLVPVVFAGLVLGDYAHDRVPERAFRICLYLALLLSGAALIAASL